MPKEIEAQHIFVPALGIFLGVALVIIDSTLVNVALPVMARELHISDGAATFFVQAYQIVLLTLLFPAIALSPLVGCKRFFLCGIALFVAASLGCALSRTPGSLCLFRILQAVGGSAMLSVNIALVERVFKKDRLATGIGFNTATISISIIIGPALGGFMLTHVSWPWLFAINLPLGLLALLAAWKHVPGEQNTRLAREHLREFAVILGLSILLFAGFLASLGVFSWGLPWQILPGTLLLLLCGTRLLVRQQRVGRLVLFPEHVLLNKPFLFSLLVTIVCFMAQSGTVLAMPFAFMEGLGFDIQDTSLLLVAWPALHSVTSLASGKLGKLVRRGNRAVLGIILGACGIVLFAFAPDASIRRLAAVVALCGLGYGLFRPQNSTAMLILASAGMLLCTAGILLLALVPAPSFWRMASIVALCGLGYGLFQVPNETATLMFADAFDRARTSSLVSFCRTLGQTLGTMVTAGCLLKAPFNLELPFLLAALAGGMGVLLSLVRAVKYGNVLDKGAPGN